MLKKRDIFFVITLMSLFAMIVVLLETGKIVKIENIAYTELSEWITPTFTVIVKIITNIGGPLIILSICLVLLFLHTTRKKFGIPVTIAVVSSFLLNTILKNIFARPRPDVLRLVTENSYSFPSGHSMINASLYTILVLLILKNSSKKKRSVIISISLIILFLLIGISRIYLGVHYLGDVLAGWTLGVLVSFIIYLIFKKVESKNNNNSNNSSN